jgi:hypothetical protein
MPTLLLLQEVVEPAATTRVPVMDTGSWIFLLLAWTFVIGLTAWCFKRVLAGRPSGT